MNTRPNGAEQTLPFEAAGTAHKQIGKMVSAISATPAHHNAELVSTVATLHIRR